MLFSAYTDNFLTYQRNVVSNSAGEMDQKTLCFKNHLVPYFGALDFLDIRARTVQQYVATKRDAGLAPATINHHLIILRRYLSHAQQEGLLPEIPRIQPLRLKKTMLKNFLELSEVQSVFQAADKHRNPTWRPLIKLAVNTGMRIGEMLALNWKDVDFANERLEVCASFCRRSRAVKSTKNGDARVVSLNEGAMAALRQLHEMANKPTEGLVLNVNYDTAQRAMQNISKKAALGKTVTWHTLRHTFATALVNAGQPLYVVAKLLGHASVAMSERYAHLTRDRRYVAVRELNGLL